ncbi:MAG TPA: radical SAM/SPASM domain-containing protein [Pyrinomonadaceae bacterium]|nr:radical SAM/SPASM domain-containing protein [Pyrinomonadaceae bacterium]
MTSASRQILKKVRWYAREMWGRSAPQPATMHETISQIPEQDRQKIEYARSVLSNGTLPSNFSITIGVAPCNYSCLFCPQSISKPHKALWIDLELLRKCLNEMPEENVTLNVSSFSETIAAPVLVPAIRLMKEIRPKLPIAMATNGSIFRQKVVEDLIEAGLDHYSYSFDAATPEAYHTLIQVDNFEKAWKNLEQIVELRNQKKSSMKITTHIMHFKGVEEDFERFKSYWQDKVDAVVLRRVGNWGGGDQYGLMDKLEAKGFVPAHYDQPIERHPCNSIFMHFQLQPDGHYMPCIGTTPDYKSNPKYSLGHASEVTWMEAWARLGEMRRAHLAGRWNEIEACRTCNIWGLWEETWFREENQSGELRFHLADVPHAS